jgi:anti-sigma B factor antagonist
VIRWDDDLERRPGKDEPLIPSPAGGAELAISTEIRGGWLLLSLVGEIDSLTVDTLRGATRTLPPAQRLVVDLSQVGFLGSAGMSALVDLREARPGARFVVGENRRVLRPLQITGLDSVLPLYRETEAALTGEAV